MSPGAPDIRERLLALNDPDYQAFASGLLPTVDRARIIGVRMPALRRLARELRDRPEAQGFLLALPHHYLEENHLHGLFINDLKDYTAAAAALDRFLPHVDNWATCDLLSPRAFKSHPPDLYPGQIEAWLASPHPFGVRFAIGQMMGLYLDARFEPEMLERVAAIPTEEYYVRMMVAWYFATALAKQPEAALPLIARQALPRWTHNKAIQKAVESYRIPAELKTHLKTLRRGRS